MAAVFAFAAIAPPGMADGLKTGLAAALFFDLAGAFIVCYTFGKFGLADSPFLLAFSMGFFVIQLIVLFALFGYDLYAAFAIISIVRCAYDAYVFISTPLEESLSHAHKYFITHLKVGITLVFILVLAIVFPEASRFAARDRDLLGCDTALCALTSPPDPFILFGLFLYPLLGWFAFKWQPEWMRWVPSPRQAKG